MPWHLGTNVRLMTGIDTAMPDVRHRWNYHAEWNQNDRFWAEDFRQLAGLGFDLLRWGMPWSLAEPEPGVYRWDLIDPKVELANRLGMEIFFPVVHFNYPAWIAREGEAHAVLSSRLTERLASYTEHLLSRYGFRYVTPIVEVTMDALQRGLRGRWQPHLKGRDNYERVLANLVQAFRASAAVAHEYGATVVCSEPAPDLRSVLELGDAVDIAGIDLYPHLHRDRSISSYLQQWHQAIGKPLCLSEFGTPETYNPHTRRDARNQFVDAGMDQHRVQEARLLAAALRSAAKEGIPIPLGGWYPGTGNVGWGHSLTRERTGCDCDRAGLVDLARQSDGTLKRVVCRDLVREVLGLRSLPEVAVAEPNAPARVAAAAALA